MSSENSGTLLVRKAEEISKTNHLSSVRDTMEGTPEIGFEIVVLHVRFKQESELIEPGDVLPGQLIDGDNREVVPLKCERHYRVMSDGVASSWRGPSSQLGI